MACETLSGIDGCVQRRASLHLHQNEIFVHRLGSQNAMSRASKTQAQAPGLFLDLRDLKCRGLGITDQSIDVLEQLPASKTGCRHSGLAAERLPPPEPAIHHPSRRPAAVGREAPTMTKQATAGVGSTAVLHGLTLFGPKSSLAGAPAAPRVLLRHSPGAA